MVGGDEIPLQLEKPWSIYTILFIVVIILAIALFFYSKRTSKANPDSEPLVPSPLVPSPLVPSPLVPSPLATIYETIDNWIGKTLLYMNMRGDAIVYNYPFEKGFLEKLFDNVRLP
jgi:hypothetical protein